MYVSSFKFLLRSCREFIFMCYRAYILSFAHFSKHPIRSHSTAFYGGSTNTSGTQIMGRKSFGHAGKIYVHVYCNIFFFFRKSLGERIFNNTERAEICP